MNDRANDSILYLLFQTRSLVNVMTLASDGAILRMGRSLKKLRKNRMAMTVKMRRETEYK